VVTSNCPSHVFFRHVFFRKTEGPNVVHGIQALIGQLKGDIQQTEGALLQGKVDGCLVNSIENDGDLIHDLMGYSKDIHRILEGTDRFLIFFNGIFMAY
jgi:hypothetical protein